MVSPVTPERDTSSGLARQPGWQVVSLAVGLPLAGLTFASGVVLFAHRLTDLRADDGRLFEPPSGVGLALWGLGLGAALLGQWRAARRFGLLVTLLGSASVLVLLRHLAILSPATFNLAWLWLPSLESRIVVVLAGLGLLVAEERTLRLFRLGLLCLIGTVVTFISVNLVLTLALDFPGWFIGGSFAGVVLSPPEQRLLARELTHDFPLAFRSLGAAAGGLGLLLLAWRSERLAGYPWPRWLAPVTLLLGVWLAAASAGTLWAQEEFARHRPGAVVRASSPLPELTLAFGIVAASLLALALRQTARVTTAFEQVRRVNRQLEEEIDERRRVQELLAEREARLRLVLEQVPAILWTTDRELRFTSSSGAGLKDLGMDSQTLLGKSVAEIVKDGEQRAVLLERYRRVLDGVSQEFEFTFNGRGYSMRLEPLRDPSGEVIGVIGLALDVTERQQMEKRLRQLALYDPLTGLPNRAHFFQQLEALADVAAQRSTRPLALLLLDLDGFKQVNDTLGHPAGDTLLKEVGRRLLRGVRSADLVARLGGDEFVVLARGADEHAALVLAERIARELERPIRVDGQVVEIRCSVGIAVSKPEEIDVTRLLRDADIALYRAKALGRGRAVVFEPSMYREASMRSLLATRLREAIESDQLTLRYQPIVEFRSGRLYGFEVIPYWPHPERGDAPVGEVVGVAQEAGLVDAIDRWALREAAGWLAEASRQTPATPVILLHLTGVEVMQPPLAEDVARQIEEARFPARSLGFWLPEPVLSFGVEERRETIRRLRALGSPVFVDGFGGCTSLFSFTELRVSGVTISRELTALLGTDSPASVVVRALLGLAQDLSLTSLAQGVDVFEQFVPLTRLGCTLGTGALFGPPVERETALRIAREAQHWSQIRAALRSEIR